MTQGELDHSVSPSLINKRLNDICRNLQPGRQEDAHEFLRHLIDVMNENFLQRHIENLSLDDISKSTTPINQIFGGFLRSIITCTVCHHKSESFEQFMELSLDIRNVFSLKDAIGSFFSREYLDNMSYDCIRCNKKVTAQKQFHLETSPVVLCIQIKRFNVDGEKICKKIQVELHLDVSRYFSQSTNNNQRSYYKLVSMVCHNGNSTASGHYFTVGLAPNGLYYSFDDSVVKQEKIYDSIRKSNAYFLFYEVHDLDMSRAGAVDSMQKR